MSSQVKSSMIMAKVYFPLFIKIHSAAVDYVSGAINTYILTHHGIEMIGTKT